MQTDYVWVKGKIVSKTRSRAVVRITDNVGRVREIELPADGVAREAKDTKLVVWLQVTPKCAHKLKIPARKHSEITWN